MSTGKKDKPKPTKKRHHQIPQLYLRRFTSPETGEIWTYDKQTGDVRPSSVENTAYEGHLYSVTLDDGGRFTGIEELLARIEDKAAPLLEKVLRDGTLAGKERADFASFLAMMHVRTNAFRRQYAEFFGHAVQTWMYTTALRDDTFESSMNSYETACGRLSDEEKYAIRQHMLNPSDFILSVDREWTLKALGIHDTIMRLFFDMQWTLLEALEGRYFITSDNPVVRYVPPQFQDRWFSGGFTDPHIQVTLPLSAEVCWFGHWREGGPTRWSADAQTVKHLNAVRAGYAERFLYGPKRDGGIEKLARKYREAHPTFAVHGFGPKQRAEIRMHRTPERHGK